jgi:hypothetical protein
MILMCLVAVLMALAVPRIRPKLTIHDTSRRPGSPAPQTQER